MPLVQSLILPTMEALGAGGGGGEVSVLGPRQVQLGEPGLGRPLSSLGSFEAAGAWAAPQRLGVCGSGRGVGAAQCCKAPLWLVMRAAHLGVG